MSCPRRGEARGRHGGVHERVGGERRGGAARRDDRTSTLPVPAGETAVIWVALLTVNEAAGLPPKLTAVAPVRLVPVIVTLVPPAVGPEAG